MTTSPGRKRQASIYLAGMAGRRPRVPVDPDRLEQAALRKMSARAGAYVAGGAGAERTMAANRAAFDRWRLVPRMLRDVSTRDLSVELFGRRLPAPLLVAPIGVLEMAHREADLAAARAAASLGLPLIASSQASRPMEAIAEAGGRNAPRWFQLYWSVRDDLAESFVQRAEKAGYEAIVLTLDTTLLGWRPRDLDLGYLPFLRARGIANYISDPVFRALPAEAATAERPAAGLGALGSVLELLRAWPTAPLQALRSGEALEAVRKFIAVYSRPNLTWDDIPRLRQMTRLPILLKGVLHEGDARRAMDLGVDGLIVSNHGGRQVDGGVAALDALPEVVAAVDGRAPVLFDSGVRTGADVLKALCLGARAVLVGRPYVYGLALDGEAGVRAVLENLLAEMDLTLGLIGCRSVAELGVDTLSPLPNR
ncbi:L-lactate dehydrogenase [Caenispirillum salinarum AK4]|uniref:L-lactate dehydrogenase n=1 Tax=Caenispirillum salinarum AK4 TaxID=1238182 RepID=K9GY35_9PROT|nr:alpha-hydroxy-acid oxidizing protein [Caenispirillum salinarum]EKV30147.1 L-lactate dehydrogenase [Caenispirillum salinarum AK4]